MDMLRKEMLSELDEYIALCKNRLKNILSTMGWTEEDTLKDNTCSNKLLKEDKEDKDEDPLLPQSFDCLHSIVIDEDKLKTLLRTECVSIPKRFSDIQLNFTKEQKREIYDYVIHNTGKISEPELKVSVPNENQTVNDMTFAEIVAKARKKDKKLKRKYRTSKPTHIEEVRNLVHLQMQALAQYFNPKSASPKLDEHCSFRNKNRERSRRRSRSRLRERDRSKYFRTKSRSRSTDRRIRSPSKDIAHQNKYKGQLVRGRRQSKDRLNRGKDKRRSRSKSATKSSEPSCSYKGYANKYRTQSISPTKSADRECNYKRPKNHKKEKSKKRSRSRSKTHHKSKKTKHKHREP